MPSLFSCGHDSGAVLKGAFTTVADELPTSTDQSLATTDKGPTDRALYRRRIALRRGRLEEAWERFESLIDPHSGVIRQVIDAERSPGDPEFFQSVAILGDIRHVYRICGFDTNGGGTSLDPLEAKVRACGEAVERYCSFLVFPDQMIYTPYKKLAGRALSPDRFPLCTEEEYRNTSSFVARPDPGRSYHWVNGYSLTRQRELYAPSLLVYLGYRPRRAEEWFYHPISTGLGAGSSYAAAVLSGACEIIERDAMMVTWYQRLPSPRIRLSSVRDPDVLERLRRLEAAGLEVRSYLLLPDQGITTVLTLVLDPPHSPLPITCATATGFDPAGVLAKTLDEAVQTRAFALKDLIEGGKARKLGHPREVKTLDDHVSFYLNRDRLTAFDFLLDQPETVDIDSLPAPVTGGPEAMLEGLLKVLSGLGLELIAVDITSRDIREAGLWVVRAIIPGLLPLTQDHNVRFLGGDRLKPFPGPLNRWPHPFA